MKAIQPRAISPKRRHKVGTDVLPLVDLLNSVGIMPMKMRCRKSPTESDWRTAEVISQPGEEAPTSPIATPIAIPGY